MIRVLSAEAVPITFHLREGYRIAGASFSTAFNVILKVGTSDGRTGFGCASPAEEVTGESAAACLAALDDHLIPLLRERDAADVPAILAAASAAAPGCPAARAAVDIALHDLLARRAGAPLARVLGQRRERLLTSVTLGIQDDPGATLERARRYVRAGFRVLKVKVGEDWEADARLIRSLRRALGTGVTLRADGNQGYSEEEAGQFLRALEEGDLELLEQPTAAEDLAALARLADASDVPIMADEAVRTEDEARRIISGHGADLVNIKLMKSGGIAEALRIATITSAAGIGAMVGCNDESRIGIAAGLHLALAGPNTELADLDGYFDLVDDVAHGGVRIEQGYILPSPEEPGLGVSVDL
ncbi:MAG TPA: enolase C-terminal domain-like protein [Candidatus Polarisedimenticolia bacterium]|nr:enolase C-terminal domain-like protein [Candidatus Polarisedimenticolia bacterium]